MSLQSFQCVAILRANTEGRGSIENSLVISVVVEVYGGTCTPTPRALWCPIAAAWPSNALTLFQADLERDRLACVRHSAGYLDRPREPRPSSRLASPVGRGFCTSQASRRHFVEKRRIVVSGTRLVDAPRHRPHAKAIFSGSH